MIDEAEHEEHFLLFFFFFVSFAFASALLFAFFEHDRGGCFSP